MTNTAYTMGHQPDARLLDSTAFARLDGMAVALYLEFRHRMFEGGYRPNRHHRPEDRMSAPITYSIVRRSGLTITRHGLAQAVGQLVGFGFLDMVQRGRGRAATLYSFSGRWNWTLCRRTCCVTGWWLRSSGAWIWMRWRKSRKSRRRSGPSWSRLSPA